VNENHVSSTATSTDTAHVGGKPASPVVMPQPPVAGVRPSRWTRGRITALVIGSLLVLASVGLLGGGVVALWANATQRDAAGYVTTDVHTFSTSGSALATEPARLDSPGVGWLYSSVLLGNVRIRVTPANTDSALFVGIGPTDEVDRYLAGVSHSVISDFWTNAVEANGRGTPGSAPGTQDFWVASATGPGAQTLTWDPANGSWTVVVMNADGRPGVDVGADLGAEYPALLGIAIGVLAIGALLLVVGGFLIAGAIRRSRAGTARTV
jgi:hypothetical protein